MGISNIEQGTPKAEVNGRGGAAGTGISNIEQGMPNAEVNGRGGAAGTGISNIEQGMPNAEVNGRSGAICGRWLRPLASDLRPPGSLRPGFAEATPGKPSIFDLYNVSFPLTRASSARRGVKMTRVEISETYVENLAQICAILRKSRSERFSLRNVAHCCANPRKNAQEFNAEIRTRRRLAICGLRSSYAKATKERFPIPRPERGDSR